MTKAIVGKKRVTISLDHCNSKVIKYFFSVFFHSTGGTLCLMSYLYQPARREMQTWKPLLVSFVACVIIHVNSSTLVNIYLHLGFSSLAYPRTTNPREFLSRNYLFFGNFGNSWNSEYFMFLSLSSCTVWFDILHIYTYLFKKNGTLYFSNKIKTIIHIDLTLSWIHIHPCPHISCKFGNKCQRNKVMATILVKDTKPV